MAVCNAGLFCKSGVQALDMKSSRSLIMSHSLHAWDTSVHAWILVCTPGICNSGFVILGATLSLESEFYRFCVLLELNLEMTVQVHLDSRFEADKQRRKGKCC